MSIFPNEDMRRFIEAGHRIAAPVLNATRPYAEWHQRMEPHVQRMAEIARSIEEGPRLTLIRSFTFARGGWHDAPLFNVPGGLKSLVDELVDKPNEEVRARLDQVVPEIFRKDDHYVLEDMVARWDFYPGWRNQVFEDAVWAHKNEKYSLSVPALAPQIEGILRQETGEYRRGPYWIRKVNNVLGFEYDSRKPPAPPTEQQFEEALDALLSKELPDRYATARRVSLELALFRVNALYNHGAFDDPQFVNSANRHAILHGVSENLSELTSIKLFCAVQLVHEIAFAYRKAAAD